MLYCHIFHFLLIAVLAFVGPLSQRQQSAFNNEGKILYSIFHLIFYLAVELTMQQKRTTQFQHLSQTIPGKSAFRLLHNEFRLFAKQDKCTFKGVKGYSKVVCNTEDLNLFLSSKYIVLMHEERNQIL